MTIALRKIETAEKVALGEDQWRIVVLYLQTVSEALQTSKLEALFLNDLLKNWHGPLSTKQQQQLMEMYEAVSVDDDDLDEHVNVDEIIVKKFLGQLH